MNYHGSKQERLVQLGQKFIWQVRSESVLSECHSLKPPSSLGSGWNETHCPPAGETVVEKW